MSDFVQVGANRVVVLDASWNPCHDSQAVCRVYRYGQQKTSYIYRLVMDNSLEKKIYDRQINKQGMSDRVVDESNPDSHLSSKDISSLICEDEDDPPEEIKKFEDVGDDDLALSTMLSRLGGRCLTKPPFAHESLLIDRREKRLTKAEKRLAERSYQMEKGARVSYSRPSYTAYYPTETRTSKKSRVQYLSITEEDHLREPFYQSSVGLADITKIAAELVWPMLP